MPDNHNGRADLKLALAGNLDDPLYRKALNQAAGRDLLRESAIRRRTAK